MYQKVFYKYRKADDFTIALLEKQEIKFSCAEEYSDPFDSKLIVNIDIDNDIDSILRRLEKTTIDEGEKQVLRERIRRGEFSNNQFVKTASIVAERIIMSSCFAGNFKDLLLWSHYADSHKGICIGLRNCSSTDIAAMKFNVKDCCLDSNSTYSDGLFIVHKVNYSNSDIGEWNPFVENIQVFIDAHRNKAKCWKYEDEYRLIVVAKEFNSNILCFDPYYLVEVYLGCCIKYDFREKVLQVLKANYLNKGIDVKVFEMFRSKTRFALEKKELVI